MNPFRVFPATISRDGRKIPLISDWAAQSSTDPEQLRLWSELFRDRLRMWGIPCGAINDLLVLDVDVKGGGLETIKTLAVPDTLYQQTISGGLHYFFRFPKDGAHYGNRVKFMPGLDTRGTGGWAAYYGFANPQTPIAEAPTWLLDELRSVHTLTPSGDPAKVDPSIAERIILEALDNVRSAPQGESNNILNIESFKLGQLVVGGSITREYASQVLLGAARERGKPERESIATINSGLDGGSKKPLIDPFGSSAPVPAFEIPQPPGPPARWTPQHFTREDILNTTNLRKPQLFEHWSTEDITITTADGGTGKTTLKLYEAICMALGDRFLDFNCLCPGGRTLFITGEDTAEKLAAMIGQILRAMGLFEDFPGFKEKVDTVLSSVIVKKDADLCLIVKDRQGFLTLNPYAMASVMQAVEDFKPKMIVFDPISSFWGSESALNDMNKAVTKFMSELVERSKACVEMINHMGKVSSATKDMSQFAGRGGTGLPSNSRVSRVLRPVFGDEYMDLTGETLEERQSAMMCVVNKFSDGSPLFNKPFLILREGFTFRRKALSDTKQKETEQNHNDNERVFTFIKAERQASRWPNQMVVTSHFMGSISAERVKRAINMLGYTGLNGEKVVIVDNPDQVAGGKVLDVLTI